MAKAPLSLGYLTTATLPSKDANAVHSVNMAHSFAQLGLDVSFYVASVTVGSMDALRHFYGASFAFPVFAATTPRLPVGAHVIRGGLVGRSVKRRGVSAVYGRDFWACVVTATFGIPTVFDAHVLFDSTKALNRWGFSLMVSSRGFRGITVTSARLRQAFLEKYQLPREKVVVAYNGANDKGHIVNAGGQQSRLQVGYVGQLYPGKGMELIDQITRVCDHIDFHIIGGNEEDVAHWAAAFKDREHVRFYGFVAPARLDEYISVVDVLLAPYQDQVVVTGGNKIPGEWIAPLKIFEAMGARKVIVASRLAVAEEVVRHGETGFLCDPKRPEEWIMTLTMLGRAPDIRHEVASRAYADFSRRFSWRARAETALRLLSHDHN